MGCNARKDIMKCKKTGSCDGCFQECAPKLFNAAGEILSDFNRHGEVLQQGDNGEYGTESSIGQLSEAIGNYQEGKSQREKREELAAEELSGININEEPLHVNHSDLKRDNDSPFRSTCPVCEVGLLLVQRDTETLELLEQDRCILCGQLFIYCDIDKMRSQLSPP